MYASIELPTRIDASEKAASLDDILGTMKINYTALMCDKCGRASMLTELDAPVVRETVAA
jgi:hypothetical protein